MLIFVLLYNNNTEQEGIHTVQVDNHNTILMFASGVGANYYASLLEAYGFPKPTPTPEDSEIIREFCLDVGYSLEFIPADRIAIPPREHVSSGFWQNFQETTVSRLDSKQKEYYLITLRDTYFLFKRNIVDLQQERARIGFSVQINRQIEYYTEELNKIEMEIQRWF